MLIYLQKGDRKWKKQGQMIHKFYVVIALQCLRPVKAIFGNVQTIAVLWYASTKMVIAGYVEEKIKKDMEPLNLEIKQWELIELRT